MTALSILSGIVLVASLSLGGGTMQGFSGDVLAQLLSVPLLVAALAWAWAKPHSVPAPGRLVGRQPWMLVAAPVFIVALFAVYAVELPYSAVSILHTVVVKTPALAVETAAALERSTLSLAPQATWAAVTSLLPLIAIFIAVSQLTLRHRLKLGAIIVIIGGCSAILGFMQVAQGSASSLRFFEITNSTEAVGFFANRNHFAALLWVTLLLFSPWLLTEIGNALHKAGLKSSNFLIIIGIVAFIILVVAGIVLARSRAGIMLAMGALVGIALLASFSVRPKRPEAGPTSRRAIMAILGFALLFAAQFGFYRIQSRLEQDPLEDLRVALNATTLEAIWLNLPFGTGLGSFVPVYALYEKQADLFTGFANRAHNDIAEFALEGGMPAMIIMTLFFAWFIMRASAVWLRPAADASDNGVVLQRACSIAIALLVLHSLVDYPLRTTALGAVFAFCCAVLMPAAGDADRPKLRAASAAATRPIPATDQSVNDDIVGAPQEIRSPRTLGKLNDVDWPDAWRSD